VRPLQSGLALSPPGTLLDPGRRSRVACSDSMEVVMHIVVQHRITDPEKFFSMDAEEVGGGGPPGV
jgi:hypothetical protein